MLIAREAVMVLQYQRSQSCHRNVMHIKYSFMSFNLVLFHCLLNHALMQMTTASEKRKAVTAIVNDRPKTLIVVALREFHF
jgi:hypothetical protein